LGIGQPTFHRLINSHEPLEADLGTLLPERMVLSVAFLAWDPGQGARHPFRHQQKAVLISFIYHQDAPYMLGERQIHLVSKEVQYALLLSRGGGGQASGQAGGIHMGSEVL
jgi:hypothetical protein